MPGYTPRFLAAVRRRYEDTDEPMSQIAFHYGISLRTLHRMVEHEGWRKRGDRPPKDLCASELLLQAVEVLARVQKGQAPMRDHEALMQQYYERARVEREELRRRGVLPPPG